MNIALLLTVGWILVSIAVIFLCLFLRVMLDNAEERQTRRDITLAHKFVLKEVIKKNHFRDFCLEIVSRAQLLLDYRSGNYSISDFFYLESLEREFNSVRLVWQAVLDYVGTPLTQEDVSDIDFTPVCKILGLPTWFVGKECL